MSDVTITRATVSHALSATTPDNPADEIRPSHWNNTHAASVVLAAAVMLDLFSNANGFSFGVSDSAITGSYTVPTQSVQTQASGNIAGAGFTSTTTAGVDVKGTHNSAGLSMAVPAYITTYAAQSVQTQASGNIPRSGFTTTTVAGDKIVGTHDTDGLKLAVPAYLTAAAGGGAGTGFTTTTVGGAVVAGTLNSDGLLIAVPAYLTTAQAPGAYLTTARASTDAIGLNTAQTNVTWTANSSGLSINAAGYAGTGTSATNASITMNSNGLAISVAAPGGGAGVTVSEFAPYMNSSPLTNSALGQNSLYFVPFDLQENLSAYRVNIFLAVSTQISASNNTKSGGYTCGAALYTRGTGASTERLSRLWSASAYISFSASSHTRIQIAHPAGILNSTAVSQSSTSGAATNTSTYVVSSVSGFRVVPLPISSTLTPGRYWFAFRNSSTSANAQGLINAQVLLQTTGNQIAYRPFGTSSAASNASVFGFQPGFGTYSATSGGFPASIGLSNSDIRLPIVMTVPAFNFSAYTTGTNIL